ncbi:hypothetical protein Tco_0489170 [Tanacetum coccineum]
MTYSLSNIQEMQFDSQVSNWEDGISTSSLSEAEEKTIKAVYEQMMSLEGDNSRKDTTSSEIYETVRSEVRRAIAVIQDNLQDKSARNTGAALVSTDVTDASKLVKPGAVGLKNVPGNFDQIWLLRNIIKILKETLPKPKTSSSHMSRGRKSSLAEDPFVNSLTTTPIRGATSSGPNCCIGQQMIHDNLGSSSVVASSFNELLMDRVLEITNSTESERKTHFSFGHKPMEGIELQHDIKNYIKTFENDKDLDDIVGLW